MANTYSLITSNTLTSDSASVIFNSIPQTFTDLIIRGSARVTAGGSLTDVGSIRFNSDTSTINSLTDLQVVETTTVASTRGSTLTKIMAYDAHGSTGTSNTFSNFEIYIPSYRSSFRKVLSGFSVAENNGASSATLRIVAGLYRNTAAITTITLLAGTPNFAIGSTFWLYGIKNS